MRRVAEFSQSHREGAGTLRAGGVLNEETDCPLLSLSLLHQLR